MSEYEVSPKAGEMILSGLPRLPSSFKLGIPSIRPWNVWVRGGYLSLPRDGQGTPWATRSRCIFVVSMSGGGITSLESRMDLVSGLTEWLAKQRIFEKSNDICCVAIPY